MLFAARRRSTAGDADGTLDHDAFMKEWGAERNKKTKDTAQHDYPKVRDISGENSMREITLL